MALSKGLFSSTTDLWATPQAFFDALDAEFHFELDPCATPDNAKCAHYFTPDQDGLKQDWGGVRTFCNPPYGRVFYTGPIDALLNEQFGRLPYRSLHFETEILKKEQTQGCPVVNYCDHSVKYTRRIEHNAFAPSIERDKIVVSYEYSVNYTKDAEPYYPIPSEENKRLYARYLDEAGRLYGDKFVFGGRLGGYKYFAMDDTILDTLEIVKRLTTE